MICKRCQRSLRSGEGTKGGICDSCFQMRYNNDSGKEHRECGDRGYQWKCSLCQNYVSNLHSSSSDTTKDRENAALLQAVNAITEKFELVNKIQLPKLSSELAQIKSVTDRIVQQNEDILKRMEEVKEKRKPEKQLVSSTSRYRRRNITLTPKSNIMSENNEDVSVTMAEKTVRYRTRRRSYLLHKIFKILNRKMKRTHTPRTQ
ncbi:uncharacterized protein LOC142986684 [Anticarsia gemmatalis]|uniref:uncharacterized protein LOC142986684 n=1 Tax=Anticarsia gemmatalis TaxID=129554 RepID=UPI003F7673D8